MMEMLEILKTLKKIGDKEDKDRNDKDIQELKNIAIILGEQLKEDVKKIEDIPDIIEFKGRLVALLAGHPNDFKWDDIKGVLIDTYRNQPYVLEYLDSLCSGHYEQDEEDYDDNIYKKPVHVGRKFIIDRPEIINDMLSVFIVEKE